MICIDIFWALSPYLIASYGKIFIGRKESTLPYLEDLFVFKRSLFYLMHKKEAIWQMR